MFINRIRLINFLMGQCRPHNLQIFLGIIWCPSHIQNVFHPLNTNKQEKSNYLLFFSKNIYVKIVIQCSSYSLYYMNKRTSI